MLFGGFIDRTGAHFGMHHCGCGQNSTKQNNQHYALSTDCPLFQMQRPFEKLNLGTFCIIPVTTAKFNKFECFAS